MYHVHKWWAQRLGSVFRGALIGAAAPAGADVEALLRGPTRLDGHVVLDPFMGSGTTVGEAHKLGARAVGLDINPVAVRAARVALGPLARSELETAFAELEARVAAPLRALHATTDADGGVAEALYWFWVKLLPCPDCQGPVELFSTRIFARHAYPAKKPRVHASCPRCGGVTALDYRDPRARCESCAHDFDPHTGPVERAHATCPSCRSRFSIVDAARASGAPPAHRLFAKLALTERNGKVYLPITEADRASYAAAERALAESDLLLPNLPIEHGHNTRQILAYGYRHWRDAFNARQLLGLGTLARAISELEPGPARDALGVLFSGTLEFNNLFATYKGEGTGAVRHMFAHHILKPERTPIEANPWGNPKSSGAFSTLFQTRLLRALDYRDDPFELVPSPEEPRRGRKVFGLSEPMGGPLHDVWPKGGLPKGGMLITARDARDTGLPARSVDLVVTDPPYFDNVHYSELADFFAAWTEAWSGAPPRTTRVAGEVQDVDAERFSGKLRAILGECARVTRDDGLLVLSYHHSREEGWRALGRALLGAGFSVVQAHPVKAELSRSAAKAKAKRPIDIDVLLVARKTTCDSRRRLSAARALGVAAKRASERADRYQARVRPLSAGDARVLLVSQLLVALCPGRDATGLDEALGAAEPQIAPLVQALLSRRPGEPSGVEEQLELFAPGGDPSSDSPRSSS